MFLGLVTLIFCIFWGLKNKLAVPFIYLFWITLLPYFFDILIPFTDKDNLFEFRTFGAYYIFIMLIIQLLKIDNLLFFLKSNRKVLFSLFLLVFYFGYLSINRGTGFNYISYLRTNLSPVFLFFYLSIVSPSRNSSLKFILITTFTHIAIGLIQLFSDLGDFSFNREGEGIVSFVTGGFTGNNLFADFLSFITIILLSEYKFNKQFFLSNYIPLLVIFSAYLIFVSGIRLSLGTFIIGIIIHLYLNYPKARKYLLFSFLLFICLFLFGNYFSPSENVVHDWHVTSNSERQSGLLGIFSGWEYLQYSTIAFSWFLISEYFVKDIFFGCGLYFTSSGYGGIISYKTANATDVTLALFITEFGITALLLLIYHFKTIFYFQFKKFFGKKIFLPLFITFLITITDSGLFDNIIMSYFYLYLFIHQPTRIEKL